MMSFDLVLNCLILDEILRKYKVFKGLTEPPFLVVVVGRWPVLLQNIKSEESKPSSTTSNSSSQSKVSKKVRYSKYGEISLNLLRIIIQYSNIIYLTNTCFNSGLKLRNKKFSQFDVSGKSDLSENDLT